VDGAQGSLRHDAGGLLATNRLEEGLKVLHAVVVRTIVQRHIAGFLEAALQPRDGR
jgi:hypothetical protein